MGVDGIETSPTARSQASRTVGASPQSPVTGELAIGVLHNSRPVEQKCRVQNAESRTNTKADAPTVTVLMAVYNGARYLREALESILCQSFRDFEFLIIDDGSTDDTLAILNEYARKDARICIISQPNRGLTKTLNQGVRLAR